MRCTNCRERLPAGAKFCSNCGSKLDKPEFDAAAITRQAITDRLALQGRSAMAEDDEEIIWAGNFSARGLIHSWLLAIVLTIVLPSGGKWVEADRTQWIVIGAAVAAVWLGLGVYLAFQKLNVRYVLTNRRLIHRTGILLQRTDRLELIDINDVSHHQSIIERIFDVGTIEVTSSDRSHPYIELPGINQVEDVAMLIDDARLRERAHRGVHVEQL